MKKMTARLAPTVFLGAIATGCVHVSTTPIGNTSTAVPVDSVQVFATRKPAEYREIAVLKTRRFLATDRKTLAALRDRAAELGANGLLLVNAENSATQRHEGTGVIWTRGSNDPSVVSGSGTTRVDEFEKAIAIKVDKP